MDKKLENEMNLQINKELFSAYLYLSMSSYFEDRGLSGCSSWMQMQAQEEVSHAMKFFTYLNDRGCRVVLEAIEKPELDFSSVTQVFEKTLAHEKMVTESINKLYSLARSVDDNASQLFLSWFITEQVEEEKIPTEILAKLEFIKEDSVGMLMLDKELGARVAPAAQAE